MDEPRIRVGARPFDEPSSPRTCDVLIRGAGPAGATLATILARAGRDVLLVHRAGPGSGVDEETVVPSARGLFARLGLLEIVASAGFTGTIRHGHVWGSDEIVLREARGDQCGFKIVRAEFDAQLRDLARQSGARILEGARATEIAAETNARITVDATGRASSDPGIGRPTAETLPAMLAFSAHVPCPDEWRDTTFVEAVREGWLWWLPLAGGGASLTLFCDRDEARAAGREVVWRRATSAAHGPARGVDAEPRRGTAVLPRLHAPIASTLHIGDAASTIDPLSSQGLEKALASAEHAAACANALLEGRIDPRLVHAHQQAWESRLFHAHRRETLAFYAREKRSGEAPFWRVRHELAQIEVRQRARDLPPRLAPHPRLEAAIALRSRADSLEPVPGWRIEGSLLAHAQVGSMPVSELIECCGSGASLEDALRRAARLPGLCELSPRQVLDGLRSLVDEGLLVG